MSKVIEILLYEDRDGLVRGRVRWSKPNEPYVPPETNTLDIGPARIDDGTFVAVLASCVKASFP